MKKQAEGEEEEEEEEPGGEGKRDEEEETEDGGEGGASSAPSSPPPEPKHEERRETKSITEVLAEVVEPPQEFPKNQKKLPNAFNFCERAAMTYNNPFRDMASQTIPLPRGVFCGIVSGWMIYDFYAEDYERQQREKEKEKKPLPGATKGKEPDKKRLEAMMAEAVQMRMFEAAKIIDRMICQNLYDDIAFDYKYYEDPSDEYRQEEGTLLPLWKFCYEKTKKLAVTEMQWNSMYYDLFAVAFGSYDFLKQPSPGAICLFTLKNPSYPEYIRFTDVSILSLSMHHTHSHLIAVGRYDGNIAIYNKNLPDADPQYQSNSVTNKHLGPVWQVRWGDDLQDGEMNVFSISYDGKVNNWVMMQSELVVTTVIVLTLPIEQVPGPDGAMVSITASGTTITFHPLMKNIYMVGTEEGKIFKCSTLYRSKYIFTYEAHTMPIHKLSYNRFCPSIFLSCSSDWTVKIWADMRR
ncbi:UNVERIFIED_CONTAM: hypothetical protein PYX00_000318 [Menopon gallinae]|uniref:Dynein intermediate chain 2, ciliary n=1 Tax=Menopon gallinae TaxID=328185 RepID=A0AAW2I9G7_9NEOP